MTDTHEYLGTIVLCQIHTDRMVNGGRYETHHLMASDRLWLTPDGLLGETAGVATMHAHHRSHPNKFRSENTRNFLPHRLLSIGFTGHERLRNDRFGEHPSGIGAEDVVVDCDRRLELSELGGGVQIRTGAGPIDLVGASVAKPCVPFTKHLLGDQDASDEVVAPNRAFLDDGMRGFLFGLENMGDPVAITVGDEVWAVRAKG